MALEYLQTINTVLASLALSVPRYLACFLLVPMFSTRQLHGVLRLAVAVGVSIPVAVAIYYQQADHAANPGLMLVLLLKEAVIGALLGFLLALPFWIFESIGTLFDTQRGALMGQQLNPETGSMSSVMGTLFFQSIIILMIEMGAFFMVFGVVMQSYLLWPAWLLLPDISPDAMTTLIAQFGHLMSAWVMYALPCILVLGFIELIFALVGLYSPQLQVYFLAMPAKSLAGLLVFIAYASVLWEHGQDEFLRLGDTLSVFENIFPSFISH